MESTGSERRGLIILLSIIGLIIIAALISGIMSRTDRTDKAYNPGVPADSSVSIHEIKYRERPDTGVVKKKRRKTGKTKNKIEREYRQRDFYGETVDN